jgi:hypothetical protein
MSLRPDRFCNYVYAWSVARVEDRAEFDIQMLAPLPGQAQRVKPTEAEMEREGDEFMSFMSAVTGS